MESEKKILLHVCCGPCATASIERLLEDGWKVDLFYSNSNISPRDEYDKRLEGVKKTAEYFGVGWSEDQYDHDAWLSAVAGFEAEPERGARCGICFEFGLGRTAEKARQLGYDGFTSTLSISPHKNSRVLFSAGHAAETGKAEPEGVLESRPVFVEYDFKKKNGFKRSTDLAIEIGLYRQNYCGCEFSIR